MSKNQDLFIYDNKNIYYLVCNYIEGKRVLDAACGNGDGIGILSNYNPENITGVDIDVAMINQAVEKYKDFDFKCADIEQLTKCFANQKFDIIISNQTIEHVRDPKSFLQSLWSLLDDDGLLVIGCPNDFSRYSNIGLDYEHQTAFSLQKFSDLLNDSIDVLPKIYTVFPMSGVLNIDISEMNKIKNVNGVALLDNFDVNQCISYIAIYEKGDASLNINDSYICPMGFNEWNKLVKYDYVYDLSKDRMIYELQQRSMFADALEVELQLMAEQLTENGSVINTLDIELQSVRDQLTNSSSVIEALEVELQLLRNSNAAIPPSLYSDIRKVMKKVLCYIKKYIKLK